MSGSGTTGTARHIDYLTWAMLVIGVGIFGFVLFYVGSLQNSVASAKRQLAATSDRLGKQEALLRQDEQQLLQKQQQLQAIEAALKTTQAQLAVDKASTKKACEDLDKALKNLPSTQPSGDVARLMTVRSDICEVDRTLQAAVDGNQRSSLVTKALQQRYKGDFGGAADNFQKALQIQGATPQSQAQTLTWYGYSLFRSGKLQEARRMTKQALRLDPHNVVAGINDLKLMCRDKATPDRVQEAYRNLLKTPAIGAADLCAVQSDAELYRVCGYAGLGPTSKCATAD